MANTQRFDVNQVPEYARESIGAMVLETTRQVFARPGVMEDYQKWLKEYKKRVKK